MECGVSRSSVVQQNWKFFPNSARSHWLLRGHMIANNETVSRQNLWAGNMAILRHERVTVHCYLRMLNAPDIYFHKFVNEKFLLRGLHHLKTGPSENN